MGSSENPRKSWKTTGTQISGPQKLWVSSGPCHQEDSSPPFQVFVSAQGPNSEFPGSITKTVMVVLAKVRDLRQTHGLWWITFLPKPENSETSNSKMLYINELEMCSLLLLVSQLTECFRIDSPKITLWGKDLRASDVFAQWSRRHQRGRKWGGEGKISRQMRLWTSYRCDQQGLSPTGKHWETAENPPQCCPTRW